jgi:hypothetical protein
VLEVNDESEIHRWPLGVTISKPPLINSVDPTLPTGKVAETVGATVVVAALVVVVGGVVPAVVVVVSGVVEAEVLAFVAAVLVVGVGVGAEELAVVAVVMVAAAVINGVVVAADVVVVVVAAAVENVTIGDVLATLTSFSVSVSTSMPCTRGARVFRRNVIRSPSWSMTVTRT